MFKQQKGNLKVLPSLLTEAGVISKIVQGQHGCRAMQESSIPQRGTSLLLTAQGRDCSLLQWPYLRSVSSLNHTSEHPTRTTGVFLWALHWTTTTTPVSHQAESIFIGEAQQQEVSKPLHHPARARSRRQANNIQLLQSPFLALLVSQTPQAGFRSCEVKGRESTWCPSSMGSSRHVLEQGWETKQSRWPADYTSPKP